MVYEKLSAVSPWKLPRTVKASRSLSSSLNDGRMSLKQLGVTDTPTRRPDELLCLFALLILLSTVAIQIRAYGPLGSQGGGQPQRCSTRVYERVHACV